MSSFFSSGQNPETLFTASNSAFVPGSFNRSDSGLGSRSEWSAPKPPASGLDARPEVDYRVAGLIGAELAGPLNTMRQIIHEFGQTKRISRSQMLSLVGAVEAANGIARQSQQIARIAEGRLRQSHERLHLDQVVAEFIEEHQSLLEQHGTELRQHLKAIEILIDPGMLSALIAAALDWAINTSQRVQVNLSMKIWPEHAILTFKAGQGHTGAAPLSISAALAAPATDPIDTVPAHLEAELPEHLNDHLINLLAEASGVTVERQTNATESVLQFEFPRTVKQIEGMSAVELDAGGYDAAFAQSTRAFAGARIMLVSNDPMVRVAVEDTARNAGVTLAVSNTVDKAVRMAELDLPHLIMLDERLRDAQSDALVSAIKELSPNFGLIEITEGSNTFEISSWMQDSSSRISRDVLQTQLPAVLALELAKSM